MSEWVSVDQDTPCDGVTVLIYGRNICDWDRAPIVRFGRFVHTLGEWRMDGSNSNWTSHVTHWMPLPEPPDEA